MTINRINSDFDRVRERYRNDEKFRFAVALFYDGYTEKAVMLIVTELDAESMAAAKKFGIGMKRLSDMLDSLDETKQAS